MDIQQSIRQRPEGRSKVENMARSDQLPIFIDTYQFVKELYHMTHKFSREFKYCLGSQMNSNALQLLYHIFQANHTHGSKLPHLGTFFSITRHEYQKEQLRKDKNE